MSRSRRTQTSIAELARGAYLDFEGFEKRPPWMASLRIEGRTETVVFPDQSPDLAIAARAKGLRLQPLNEFLEVVIDLAIRERRRIVAYSRREIEVFKARGPIPPELEEAYLDVRKLAVAWRAKCHPEAAAKVKQRRRVRRSRNLWRDASDNGLPALATLAGIETPPNYGTRRTTRRLRDVANQIASRGDFHLLTPVAKGKWTNLIVHNVWDCEAMELLARIAAAPPGGR